MKAWIITTKDLWLLVRDKRALAVLIAFPLIFITILGITTGQLLGWQAENQVLKIAFVDKTDPESIQADGDNNLWNLSREQKQRNEKKLVVDMMNTLQKQKGMRVDLVSEEEGDRRLKDGDANAVILFGPKFFETVHSIDMRQIFDPKEGSVASDDFKALDIEVRSRPSFEGLASVAKLAFGRAMQAHVGSYVSCTNNFTRRQNATRCEEWSGSVAEYPVPEMMPPQSPDEEREASGNTVYQELVPSYTVLFVFFLVNIMARSFIHERELGTLRRLRIAPIGPAALLAGKTLPFLVVSLVQSSLLFLAGRVLFNMNWGVEPWLLIPVIFCTSLSATGLGLLVATWVRTDSQVSAYANLIVITTAGISGCFMPRDWLPPIMRDISLGTPHAWALMAYHEILNSATPNLQQIMKSCGFLIGFAALFFVIGVVRFTKTK